MDVVLAAARKLGWPEAKIHKESFGGATGGAPFSVKLARSAGWSCRCGKMKACLEALEAAGLEPPCLCRGGACGVCELPVLAGRAGTSRPLFVRAEAGGQYCDHDLRLTGENPRTRAGFFEQ